MTRRRFPVSASPTRQPLQQTANDAMGQKRTNHRGPKSTFVRVDPIADKICGAANVRFVPILLQKSQIAERQFSRQKTSHDVIAD
jgi:hypothetical protein